MVEETPDVEVGKDAVLEPRALLIGSCYIEGTETVAVRDGAFHAVLAPENHADTLDGGDVNVRRTLSGIEAAIRRPGGPISLPHGKHLPLRKYFRCILRQKIRVIQRKKAYAGVKGRSIEGSRARYAPGEALQGTRHALAELLLLAITASSPSSVMASTRSGPAPVHRQSDPGGSDVRALLPGGVPVFFARPPAGVRKRPTANEFTRIPSVAIRR
jgi:hypothetical protein